MVEQAETPEPATVASSAAPAAHASVGVPSEVASSAIAASAPPTTVALLVFFSGLCALVYQVTWLRELRLVFGASTPASAAVLAVFMGGLGLGGLLLGRRAERSPRPLAFYGRLEIGAALVAGVSPWTVLAARRVYLATGGSAALGLVGSTLVRLMLTALVLGVATFLMGGTLPAVGRAVTGAADRGRRALGWLYGCNTLGAVAGASLTTFLLLETLGQRKSLWLAALVNLLVGITAVSLARRHREAPRSDEREETAGAPTESAAVAPLPLVLAAAALVGFAFFLMEMVWYRLLTPLLGGTTYTFGTILLLALAGIGVGGLLYGAAARARPATLAGFAATCGIEALLTIAPLALSYRLAVLASNLRGLAALDFAGLVGGWLLVAGIVVLPASLVAGYQFPLLIGLLGRGRHEVAVQTGLVVACNTAGAIAGALAGGFGLLPLLGAPGAWRGTAMLLAALALIAAAAARLRGAGWARLAGPVAAALGGVALCAAPGPGALWRHGEIGAGRFLVNATNPNELRERVLGEEAALVWEEDGRESDVAVRSFSGYAFSINGKTDGHARLDASTQVMVSLVGAVLHPAPRRSLVIGLGTGSSAGWLAAVPEMEHVDVVELEPAVVRVARDCAPVNHGVLENPKVELTLGDGREYLLTRDARWDLIVSEPSNPYRAGIASLFTTEFYRAAADRLAPGGLFVQWLQAYEVDAEVVASVYTSLGEVFPYIETWSTNDNDLLLVAAAAPLRHDLERVRRRVAAEPIRTALADTWGLVGAEGFYSGFVAGPAFARRVAAAGAPPNRDDLPVIEFGFARGLGHDYFSIADLQRMVSPVEQQPPGLRFLSREQRDALRAARAAMNGGGSPAEGDPGAQAAWLARQWRRPATAAGAAPPWSFAGELIGAEALADRGDAAAEATAERLRHEHPVEAEALLARLRLRQGRRAEAITHLGRALVGYRTDPWPMVKFMQRTLLLALDLAGDPPAAQQLLPAVAKPFSVTMLERNRRLVHASVALRAGGGFCREAFRRMEPYPSWHERFLRDRLSCYRRTGDPLQKRAALDLELYLGQQPLSIEQMMVPSRPDAGR